MESSWWEGESAAQGAAVQTLWAGKVQGAAAVVGMVPLELVRREGNPASLARDSPGSCRWIQRVRSKLQLRESSNEQLQASKWGRNAGGKEIFILIQQWKKGAVTVTLIFDETDFEALLSFLLCQWLLYHPSCCFYAPHWKVSERRGWRLSGLNFYKCPSTCSVFDSCRLEFTHSLE